nr:MAG TPA: hypothetical protein [Caudoviricetes sp.]
MWLYQLRPARQLRRAVGTSGPPGDRRLLDRQHARRDGGPRIL